MKFEKRRDRFKKDHKIEPQRPTPDIVAITFYAMSISCFASPAYLPHASKTRLSGQIFELVRPIALKLLSQNWPWADTTHISAQDIEKLG